MYLGAERDNQGIYNQAIVSFQRAKEFIPGVKDQNICGILYSKTAAISQRAFLERFSSERLLKAQNERRLFSIIVLLFIIVLYVLISYFIRRKQSQIRKSDKKESVKAKFSYSASLFEDELNLDRNGIMSDFRNDFPNLKPEEYRLASYVFAGFDKTLE